MLLAGPRVVQTAVLEYKEGAATIPGLQHVLRWSVTAKGVPPKAGDFGTKYKAARQP